MSYPVNLTPNRESYIPYEEFIARSQPRPYVISPRILNFSAEPSRARSPREVNSPDRINRVGSPVNPRSPRAVSPSRFSPRAVSPPRFSRSVSPFPGRLSPISPREISIINPVTQREISPVNPVSPRSPPRSPVSPRTQEIIDSVLSPNRRNYVYPDFSVRSQTQRL